MTHSGQCCMALRDSVSYSPRSRTANASAAPGQIENPALVVGSVTLLAVISTLLASAFLVL